ncbi:MAG: glycosyltransferase family 2 protein [Spirochaetales bacterium]|nr:glycosyltransferase family 2 protein [Spirochaetales bacterium]
METKPLISVVIIGRNEGEKLVRCIESVRKINYPQDLLEVLYVDSDSSDQSLERAREAGVDKALSLVSDRPCAAAGRNRGLRESRGELVLFLDGDTIIEPDFLEKALPSFEDESIAIVYGNRCEIHEDQFYIQLCNRDWDRTYGFTETSGGDILARRSVMEEIGGYYEIIAGEDPEMSNRVVNRGYRILHIEAKMVDHDLGIRTFPMYWKHAVRSGFAYSIVADLTGKREKALWVRENGKIMIQGFAMVSFTVLCLVLAVFLKSPFPCLLAYLGLNSLQIVRLFIKNRGKFNTLKMNLAYSALHCYVLKVPMFVGQLKYYLNKNQKLIEYK